ncbi:hypothetical protein AB0C84_25215 [Actinomadura sp. NPDC048955]
MTIEDIDGTFRISLADQIITESPELPPNRSPGSGARRGAAAGSTVS